MSKTPTCLVTDFGSTISASTIDPLTGQKPVDPAAAMALRVLHDRHVLRLILASNTMPCETRWPAQQKAGIGHVFRVALLSYPLGVQKSEPLYYPLVLAAAEAPPGQVPFVGNNLDGDVAAPIAHGIRPPSSARAGYGRRGASGGGAIDPSHP